MSNVYFTADLHLGHRNIHKYRSQFDTAEEHDHAIFDNIMSVSGKRNVLWMLGDCFFSEESLTYLREMNKGFQHINLVFGNHCLIEGKDNLEIMVKDKLLHRMYALVGYKGNWLSHAPIHPEELRGKRNIHGHTHGKAISDTDNYRCVSLEQTDYVPIEFSKIWEGV